MVEAVLSGRPRMSEGWECEESGRVWEVGMGRVREGGGGGGGAGRSRAVTA